MKKLLLLFLASVLLITGCTRPTDDPLPPFLIFRDGEDLAVNGMAVPTGGPLLFGISGSGGGGSAITNITITRTTTAGKTVMADAGVYIPVGGIDTVFNFVKSNAGTETWRFFIMNSNRDTASVAMTILQGEGSAYGEINHYPSIFIGYQSNTTYPNFIDLRNGTGYTPAGVSGHEGDIDLAVIWYLTSGKSSPTLSSPSYSSITGYYPDIASWPVRNSTVFDYKTSDDKLISVAQFDAAVNDSLLVAGFKPQFTSGWCKFAFSGNVIPFRTSGGKHGLIKVISAGETGDSYMEIAVKVQK
ncbi:MAG: hypothetical protein RBS37_09955 [Bacteroidales bacterium]|jgi:hypothetical protein|nr:hypothetical protein [Bacteroidales bacterium]